jgi:hypothetical protein
MVEASLKYFVECNVLLNAVEQRRYKPDLEPAHHTKHPSDESRRIQAALRVFTFASTM